MGRLGGKAVSESKELHDLKLRILKITGPTGQTGDIIQAVREWIAAMAASPMAAPADEGELRELEQDGRAARPSGSEPLYAHEIHRLTSEVIPQLIGKIWDARGRSAGLWLLLGQLHECAERAEDEYVWVERSLETRRRDEALLASVRRALGKEGR
jgi:hypothetical protein